MNSANSGNLVNHRSMIWAQFKVPISHMCLTAVAFCLWHKRWLGCRFEPFYCNDKYFVTEFTEFSETFRKTPLFTSRIYLYLWFFLHYWPNTKIHLLVENNLHWWWAWLHKPPFVFIYSIYISAWFMVFSKYFKQTFQNTVSFDCFVFKIEIWIQPGLVIVKFSTENRCMHDGL